MHGTFRDPGQARKVSLETGIEMPALWLLEVALLKELPNLIEQDPALADQVWKTLGLVQKHLERRKNP